MLYQSLLNCILLHTIYIRSLYIDTAVGFIFHVQCVMSKCTEILNRYEAFMSVSPGAYMRHTVFKTFRGALEHFCTTLWHASSLAGQSLSTLAGASFASTKGDTSPKIHCRFHWHQAFLGPTNMPEDHEDICVPCAQRLFRADVVGR